MIRMEIFFGDLCIEAQREYIKLFGYDQNAEDGAYPLAIIEQEDEG